MAINVTLGQVATLNNSSILGQTNANSATLTTALVDALSRSGGQPNQMTSPLDMNSNQIFNLPPPSTANSPARLADVASTTIPVSFPTLIGDVTGVLNTGTGNITSTVQNVSTTGSIKASAMPALTGDVTMSSGTTATTLSTGNAGNLNSGTLLAARMPALTGDVASTVNTVATTIQPNTVSNSKLATMTAHTYKGNNTGSTANTIDVTSTQLTADLNLFTSSLQGLTPLSGGGTANFLRADGTWATPAGGGTTLLNTLTASSSATLDDTTSITATYPEYLIVFENLLPATTSVTARVLVHSNAAFQTTTYLSAQFSISEAATTAAGNSTGSIIMSTPSAVSNTGSGFSGQCRIINPSNTTATKHVYGTAIYETTTPGTHSSSFGGRWNGGVTAVDGVRFLFSSGNITSGVVKIYGLL